MSRSARIGGGGGGRSPVDYEASGDSDDKLSEVIDIHTDHDDDDKDVEDEHDDAESSSGGGGGGGDWEADEGVMWFERRAAVIGSTGKAENHRRAIGEDAAVATATATAAAAAAAAAAAEGEKSGKDAAKNELEDNRRFWEACLANEYTQFVDCANS